MEHDKNCAIHSEPPRLCDCGAWLEPSSDPRELLDSLRWKADQVITNHAGERVWLKQIPGGITDCCSADFPCEHHALLTHPAAARAH